MTAYSMDLRKRVLADCDEGLATGQVARRFRVSPAWVRRLKQRRRETGEIAPRRQRHGPRPKLADHAEELAALVRNRPDATAKELRDQLPVPVSPQTVQRTLQRLGLTYKKRR